MPEAMLFISMASLSVRVKEIYCTCVCVPTYLHPKDAIEKEEGAASENNVPDGFNRGDESFHGQLQFWGSLDYPGARKHKQTGVY